MEIHEKIKVLIVAKCIVNLEWEIRAIGNETVLIVAKCIVNSIFLKDFQHFC